MESLTDLFQIVKKDFCDLLDFKLRGNTIEIITGIPTITSAAVSVFVSYDNGKFAISDGGWLHAGEYNNYNSEPEEGEVIDRIINQYRQFFSIKTVQRQNGTVYNYRTTEDIKLLSAAVSDVAHFVANAVNTQHIAIRNSSEEMEQKQQFHSKLNNYFKSKYGASNYSVNDLVKLRDDRSVRMNGVLRVRDNRLIRQYYIMYITGQRSDQFIKDISKATLNFKIINDFAVGGSFYQRVAILNKNASGFDKNKSGLYLQQMESVIEQEAIVDADNNLEDILQKIPLN